MRLGTRPYQQLDALRQAFGFLDFVPARRREILEWLVPVALASTSAASIAAALMDELRRRQLIVPGPFVIEQLVAAATALAERHVAHQLTRSLPPIQVEALDALLQPREGTPMSVLAWTRQPPGAPGHRALARLVEQLTCLRAVSLYPVCTGAVHPERLRKLAREGGRFTAQHLRALSPLHRLRPLVLDAFRLRAVPAAAATLRAVEHLRGVHDNGGRKWPHSLPTSFQRPSWRDAVPGADGATRRTWEHAPFHTVAIPPSGEAAHVINGLLRHEADPGSAPMAAPQGEGGLRAGPHG